MENKKIIENLKEIYLVKPKDIGNNIKIKKIFAKKHYSKNSV